MTAADDAVASMAERLEGIVEELGDLAYDALREAARSDDDAEHAEKAAAERRLTQARRAVEKAARLLAPARTTAERPRHRFAPSWW